MSVRCQGCGLEYAGSLGAGGLCPTPGTLLRPSYARLLARVPAFYRQARRLLAGPADDSLTLGEFLRAGHYPGYFTGHFVIPLVAAVWSCSPAEALGYPARLPVPVPRPPRHALGPPGGGLADGGRRLPDLRRPDRQGPVQRAGGHPGAGRSARARQRRGARRQRLPAPGSAARSSPPTPTRRCGCSTRPPRPSARSSARSGTGPARSRCTPTPACCRGPGGPGRPGTTCSATARAPPSRCTSVTT